MKGREQVTSGDLASWVNWAVGHHDLLPIDANVLRTVKDAVTFGAVSDPRVCTTSLGVDALARRAGYTPRVDPRTGKSKGHNGVSTSLKRLERLGLVERGPRAGHGSTRPTRVLFLWPEERQSPPHGREIKSPLTTEPYTAPQPTPSRPSRNDSYVVPTARQGLRGNLRVIHGDGLDDLSPVERPQGDPLADARPAPTCSCGGARSTPDDDGAVRCVNGHLVAVAS